MSLLVYLTLFFIFLNIVEVQGGGETTNLFIFLPTLFLFLSSSLASQSLFNPFACSLNPIVKTTKVPCHSLVFIKSWKIRARKTESSHRLLPQTPMNKTGEERPVTLPRSVAKGPGPRPLPVLSWCFCLPAAGSGCICDKACVICLVSRIISQVTILS